MCFHLGGVPLSLTLTLSLSLSLTLTLSLTLSLSLSQDASRIHSVVDRDLPEGLRANTASHC